VAVVKNKTDRALALFSPDAPPADAGGKVTVSDERFAGRAWPMSTWELVEPPGPGYTDASTEDAHVYVAAPEPKKRTTKKGDS
jgi:hypothetical protein